MRVVEACSLLCVIATSARTREAILPCFVDLADVLIGWALDDELDTSSQGSVVSALYGFGSLWNEHLSFVGMLLSNFMHDLEETLASDDAGHSQRFCALARCFAAVGAQCPSVITDSSSVFASTTTERGGASCLLTRFVRCLEVAQTLPLGNDDESANVSAQCVVSLATALGAEFEPFFGMTVRLLTRPLETLAESTLVSLRALLALLKVQCVSHEVACDLLLGTNTEATSLRKLQRHMDAVMCEQSIQITAALVARGGEVASRHLVAEMVTFAAGTGASTLDRDGAVEDDVSAYTYNAAVLCVAAEASDSPGVLISTLDQITHPSAVLSNAHDVSEHEHVCLAWLRCVQHTLGRLSSLPWRADEVDDSVLRSATGRALEMVLEHLPLPSELAETVASVPTSRVFVALNIVPLVFSVARHVDVDVEAALSVSVRWCAIQRISACAESAEERLRQGAADVLVELVQLGSLSPGQQKNIAQLALVRLGDESALVRAAFLALLGNVGLGAIHGMNGLDRDVSSGALTAVITTAAPTAHPAVHLAVVATGNPRLRRYLLLHAATVSAPPRGKACLQLAHCKRFLGHILGDSTAGTNQRSGLSWLPDVFLAYGRELISHSGASPRWARLAISLSANNRRLTEVWAAWECARMCVSIRLRTHLGGPAQTFAALERSLLAASTPAPVAQLPSSHRDTNLQAHWRPRAKQQSLLSIKLMLVFVDALSHHIYNSSQGCFREHHQADASALAETTAKDNQSDSATGSEAETRGAVVQEQRPDPSSSEDSSAGAFRLQPPSRSSELFFRTNQKVCDEWLMRIRPRMLSASVVCGSTLDTVRHGLMRVSDLHRQAARPSTRAVHKDPRRLIWDIESCVAPLLSALAALRESDTICGLMHWHKNILDLVAAQRDRALDRDRDEQPRDMGATPAFSSAAWMQGLLQVSRGGYERAVVELESMLEPALILANDAVQGTAQEVVDVLLLTCRSSPVLEVVIAHVVKCCSALGWWRHLSEWTIKLSLLRSTCEAAAAEQTRRRDDNAHSISSRMADSTGDGVPGWLISALDARTDPQLMRSWGQLQERDAAAVDFAAPGAGDAPHDDHDAAAALSESQRVLRQHLLSLHSLSGHKSKGTAQYVDARIAFSRARDLLLEPLAIATIDADHQSVMYQSQRTSTNASANANATCPLLAQLTSLRLAQDALGRIDDRCCGAEAELSCGLAGVGTDNESLGVSEFRLEPHKHELASWNQLFETQCVLAQTLERSAPRLKNDAIRLGAAAENVKRALIKLARKQGNLAFAHRLLGMRGPVPFTQAAPDALAAASAQLQREPFAMYETGQLLMAEGHPNPAFEKLHTMACILARALDPPSPSCVMLEYLRDCPCVDLVQAGSSHVPTAIATAPCPNQRWMLRVLLRLADWLQRDYTSSVFDELPKFTLLAEAQGGSSHEARNEHVAGRCLEAATVVVPDAPKAWLRFAAWCYRQGTKISGADAYAEEPVAPTMATSPQRVSIHYHSLAAKAYAQFLRLSSKQHTNAESQSVATLRILRTLVKYGPHVSDAMAEAAQTPVEPWIGILPQLLARMGHPHQYVADQILVLVSRIGGHAPHLLVHAAVVGVRREVVAASADSASASASAAVMSAASGDLSATLTGFRAVHQVLVEKRPELVSEAEVLIDELNRIAFLWDEQWCVLLNHLANGVHERLRKLGQEAARVAQNATLSSDEKSRVAMEKYAAIMHPVVVALEGLAQRTIRAPRGAAALPHGLTPHEHEFRHRFGPKIERALACLRVPKDATRPSSSWAPFSTLRRALMHAVSVGQRDELLLSRLSPRLVQLAQSSSTLCMPADSASSRTLVASFSDRVSVLSTKTRPKHICCTGHDGERYAYLVKGQEDLHLDQRIMQLLGMVNRLLAHDKASAIRSLRARHYAVIPISARAGLIQWVAGTTPLFQMYRTWQRSSANAPRDQQQKAGATHAQHQRSVPPPAAPRGVATPVGQDPKVPADATARAAPLPGAMFYGELLPALQTKGIANAASRQEWPMEVLKQVFRTLSSQTPRWLLEKELWATSTATSDWWSKTCTYSRSVGVMSIVGYIIGLGDRCVVDHSMNVRFCFGSLHSPR